MPTLSKEFPDIQATVEYAFTMKRVHDMIRTHSQIHHTDKYSQQSSIIYIKICKSINEINNLFISVEANFFTTQRKSSLAKGEVRSIITFFT